MSFGNTKSYENQFSINQTNSSNASQKITSTSTPYTFNARSHNPINSLNDMKRSNTFNSYPERASYKQLKIGEVNGDNAISSLNNNAKSLENFKSFQSIKELQRMKASTNTNFSKDFKFSLDFPGSKTMKNMDDNSNKMNMYSSQIVSSTSNTKPGKFGLQSFGRSIEQNQQKPNLQSLLNKNKDQSNVKINPQNNTEFNRFPTFNNIQKSNQKDNKNSMQNKSEPQFKRYRSFTNNYDKPSLTPSFLKQELKTPDQLKNQKLQGNKLNKIPDFKSSEYKLPQFKSFQSQKPNPFKKDKSQYEVASSTFVPNLDPNIPPLPSMLEKKQFYNQLTKKTNERIGIESKNSLKKSSIISPSFKYDQGFGEPNMPGLGQPNFSKIAKKVSITPGVVSNQTKIPPQQPKKICKDDFVIGKKLGKGKFGDVFLVKHKHIGFVCALKIIPKKLIRDQKLQNQFSRQVTVQFYLQHKHITALYGYFDDNDNVYLLLQLCLDGQLFTVLKQKRRLSEQQASGILKQICIGTQYMHRQRIIHRDIKPENIIMQNGVAKICDFGWAVYRADGLRQTFCGTPLYVSPQILKGQKYDEKIDIWAIGILCYQLLIGRIPFKINSENDLKRIINDQITFPQYIPISDVAKDFIMKILKKNPEDRVEIQQLLAHDFLKYQKVAVEIQASCLN